MDIIATQNLTKYYGKHKGIENVNLSVREGEIFGFISPDSTSKSTTIRTLLGLIFPTSGSATIWGKDCIMHAKDLAKDIGYLPSEVFYYDNMKVKDLLKYAASFYQKDCQARMQELCQALSLDVNKKIDDLSYGNRKKVGIVQGLLHSPKLIILDEPTSGLGPLMQQTFFEIIRQENKNGATVFFSSHILSEVQKLCDRVAIIKDGAVINVEAVHSLRENSYKKVHLESAAAINAAPFTQAGATITASTKSTLDMIYKGNIQNLIQALSNTPVTNVNIEEPDLEEIFLHYYTENA